MVEKILKSKNQLNCGSELNVTENNGIDQATQEMHQEITFNRMKQTLEMFESSIISNVQQKMDNMIDEILQSIKHYEINANEFKDFAYQQHQLQWNNRDPNIEKNFNKHSNGNNIENNDDDEDDDDRNQMNDNNEKIRKTNKMKLKRLPDKIFKPRNSYLTCLLEITHMKSIYHIFLVILTVLFLHTITYDYIVEGKINIGFDTIKLGFGNIDKGLIMWIIMQLTVFAVYYCFKLWAIVRHSARKHKAIQKIWDYFCLSSFILYQYNFVYYISIYTIKLDFALVTSFVVLSEMVRMMMKTHGFIRTNVPIQLSGKLKSNDDDDHKDTDSQSQRSHRRSVSLSTSVPIPKFSNYLYFLFAPTLLYRDEYPRTKVIRWRFIIIRLTEIIATMFFQSYFCERYIRPTFQNFGKIPMTPGNIVLALFSMMMPGLMIFLSTFYVLLHAWLNTTAELLRFADRMFYKDWWTAKNFQTYFRNWNVVVHDWLYEYIYKDCYMYVFKGSKLLSTLMTFFISALVHEYIIAISLRFVIPSLFISFAIFGVILTFIMKKYEHDFGNFILWLMIGSGNGIVISFYSMEYYARKNCPIYDDTDDGNSMNWTYYVIPRLFTCNGLVTDDVTA